MKKIFINSIENRFRSAWRISITTILIFSLMILFAVFLRDQYSLMLAMGFLVPAALWFASIVVDKRDFTEFGLRINKPWLIDFFAGNLMAIISMSGILGFLLITNHATITFYFEHLARTEILLSFLKLMVFMLAVSIWEEAYFRAYLIKNLEEGFTSAIISQKYAILLSVILSSVIFGFAHTTNPNASSISTINIALAGVVLAYPYIKTKSLGISVGMHLSWNYFQGVVFGMPVSGVLMNDSLSETEFTGPDWLTGGQFGPEGGFTGFLGILVLATTCYFYLAFVHKK